jgi:RNA polymerase sigma factor (sigma-70 family)
MPNGVTDYLRRAALLPHGAGLGDGELLGRFVERHDEAALAALVNRHGPMVWGVCRRLLSHHDAEDAFQATFLVLVRKAPAVVPRAMVGNWLYGVAHQAALQARRTVARRRAKEIQVTAMPDTEAVQQDRSPDLQPLLDQELSRLPDNYRAVIVLCDLEGRTRKEVARQLGVPEGTVGGRLARARAMLAKRLSQHGVTLSGGALAAVLPQNAASATVPSSVMASTIKAASLLAAGQATGVISAKVAALTEGVLKTMFATTLKITTVVLLAVCMIGLGTTVITYRAMAAGHGSAAKTAAKDGDKGAKDEQPKAASQEKGKTAQEPKAVFITTVGKHKLWGGKWVVEVEPVELPAGSPKALQGYLRLGITWSGGGMEFYKHFSEKWPWFVYAPAADMVMFYDGDNEVNLVTTSAQGRVESKPVNLPKEWVDQLQKQRPAAADDGKKTDAEKIRGEWKVVSAKETRGFDPNADIPEYKDSVWTFGEKEFTIKKGKTETKLGYRLNASKTPKQIDLGELLAGRKDDSLRFEGIYEIAGDKLAICYVVSNERPSDFTMAEGIAVAKRLVVLERQKK